jgi:hypothetical protein
MASMMGMAASMAGGVFKMSGRRFATVAGTGVALGSIYSTYKTDRERNINPGLAFAHGVGSALLWNEFFWPMVGLSIAPALPMVNQQYQNYVGGMQRSLVSFSPWNGGDGDSSAAQTSRARAVHAIQNSRMNARNYIGAEAGLFATRYH